MSAVTDAVDAASLELLAASTTAGEAAGAEFPDAFAVSALAMAYARAVVVCMGADADPLRVAQGVQLACQGIVGGIQVALHEARTTPTQRH